MAEGTEPPSPRDLRGTCTVCGCSLVPHVGTEIKDGICTACKYEARDSQYHREAA